MRVIMRWGVIATAVFLVACSSPTPTQTSGLEQEYNYEFKNLHPEVMVLNESSDRATVHVGIAASEVLFTRKDPQDPFKARIQLSYQVFDSSQPTLLLDSGSTEKIYPAAGIGNMLYDSFQIALPTGSGHLLAVQVMDQNRGVSETQLIPLGGTQSLGRQDFMFVTSEGTPCFRHRLIEGEAVRLICPNCDSGLDLIPHESNVSLPPPPFSDSRSEFPAVQENAFTPVEGYGYDAPSIALEEGMYSLVQKGHVLGVISVNDLYFPEIKTFARMAETTRYITSRAEYDAMANSKDPQERLETFWTDCAGSKDRARELIRIYYNRVEEANYYFTSGIPGWKTDRGLIHIVFGNPQSITKTAESEVWYYGEQDNVATLRFTFDRKLTSLVSDFYELRRDRLYKAQWERAVTSWRNGKIYEE